MEQQPLDDDSAHVRDVLLASKSRGVARIVLAALTVAEASGDPTIPLQQLADMARRSPEDVRSALRALNRLGEIGYRIVDRDVWFEIVPVSAR